MIRPTVEWQLLGACDYDCSYCIQKPAKRTGAPDAATLDAILALLAALPGAWEIKMSGGEPFLLPALLTRVLPFLVAETPHAVSLLTNLHPGPEILGRFAEITRGRLAIVSASLHLEKTDVESFLDRARFLRARMDPAARLVVNGVLVPGRLPRIARAAAEVRAAGFKFFPQLMKTAAGVAAYADEERPLLAGLLGRDPSPADANLAPNYRGRACRAGADYFVLAWTGECWRCRAARRRKEGLLGRAGGGALRLARGAAPCPYDLCPCTVPANRGMIEGVGG